MNLKRIKAHLKHEKWNSLEIITGLLLICIVVYFSYLQLTKAAIFAINSDSVNEVYFCLISFEQKSLFPEGFHCSHEPFASRPVLIYWIFYALTGNFMLSYNLEVITTTLIILFLVYKLLRLLGVRRSICLLAATLVLVGTTEETIRGLNLYPTNTYGLFTIVTFAILILRLYMMKQLPELPDIQDIKKCWIPITAIILICGLIGHTSVRPLISICVPLLFIDGMKVIWRFLNHEKISKKLLILTGVDMIATVVNVLAYVLLLILRGDSFTPLSVQIASPSDWVSWEVLSSKLQALLSAFNLIGGEALSSVYGIKTILHFALFFLSILAIIWFIKKRKAEPDALDVDIFMFWVSTTFIIICYEIVTATVGDGSIRYYYLTGMLLPILIAIALEKWCIQGTHRLSYIPVCCVLAGTIALTSITICKYHIEYQEDNEPQLYRVAQYLGEQGYTFATGTYWNSGVIRGYTNNQIATQHISDYTNMTPAYWLAYEEDFTNPHTGEKCAIILTDQEESEVLNGQGVLRQILTKEAEKDIELNEYNIYTLYENPYTAAERLREMYRADLPTVAGEIRTVYPDCTGFVCQFGSMTDQREWISDGTANMILYGPYEETVNGVYNMTLHYVVDRQTTNQTGVFDICSSDGQQYATEFSADSNAVTVRNVTFKEGFVFETRVQVPEGMVVRIQSIDYQCIAVE